MLSMLLDEEHAAEALEVGALGYAGKAQSLEEVLDAIRTVAAGRVYVPSVLSRFVVQDYLRLRRGEGGRIRRWRGSPAASARCST